MVVRMTYAADGQRRRGRPPRLSRDHIVDAACELGIENLTMAAVAERLGVTHQSLYGWVQDRDELIDLVSDRLIRQIEILPPADSAEWRDSLRSYANGLRRLAGETPGFAGSGLGRFRAVGGNPPLFEQPAIRRHRPRVRPGCRLLYFPPTGISIFPRLADDNFTPRADRPSAFVPRPLSGRTSAWVQKSFTG